jgi:TatD DNase family protein
VSDSVRLFDTHCHLQDDRILPGIDGVLARAETAGVSRMLCCASAESDWGIVAALAKRHSSILPAFGIHPWYLNTLSPSWLDTLESLLVKTPKATIGEIGLDHALDKRNDAEQERVFIAQLSLARLLRRPVSIHCRRAWSSLVRILRRYGEPDGAVIHSYSGPPDLVLQLEQLGCSLSFSGSITYDSNKKVLASAALVSENRLLIETDSPDIPPCSIGKGKNEPANLSLIVDKLANLRGKSPQEIADITFRNAADLFE